MNCNPGLIPSNRRTPWLYSQKQTEMQPGPIPVVPRQKRLDAGAPLSTTGEALRLPHEPPLPRPDRHKLALQEFRYRFLKFGNLCGLLLGHQDQWNHHPVILDAVWNHLRTVGILL